MIHFIIVAASSSYGATGGGGQQQGTWSVILWYETYVVSISRSMVELVAPRHDNALQRLRLYVKESFYKEPLASPSIPDRCWETGLRCVQRGCTLQTIPVLPCPIQFSAFYDQIGRYIMHIRVCRMGTTKAPRSFLIFSSKNAAPR